MYSLQENIQAAQDAGNKGLLENSLQDMQLLCLNHEEWWGEAEAITQRLLDLTDSDDERCSLWCDKADLLARREHVDKAIDEYNRLLGDHPDWYLARYRYASLLDELGDNEKAVQVLQSLLAEKDNLDEELYSSAEELLSDILECQGEATVIEKRGDALRQSPGLDED